MISEKLSLPITRLSGADCEIDGWDGMVARVIVFLNPDQNNLCLLDIHFLFYKRANKTTSIFNDS